MTSIAKIKTCLVMCAVALALTACGGGGGGSDEGGGGERAAGPAVDSARYAELLGYCKTSVPSGAAAANDGWVTDYATGFEYDTVSVASPGGSSVAWDVPINMAVSSRDFRGVTGKLVPSGYGKPEWKMGVRMPTVLRAGAAACVTQVARIHYPKDPLADLNIPGISEDALPAVDLTPELYWQSYWHRELPLSQLNGKAVDGFEFVANFLPEDGQVYFVISKAGFPAPQSLSVCHLPASGNQWDCDTVAVADAGENWQVSRRGVKPGVYVLNAPD